MTSPVHIDKDLRDQCHAIRDQGARPTCLACSASDAHAMHHSSPPLSAEFLFYHAIQIATVGNLTEGITFEEAATAFDKNGQPAESEWAYNHLQPDPWIPPVVTQIWRATLAYKLTTPGATLSTLISAGQPVILGIQLSVAFLATTITDFIIPADGDGFGGHAVLAVGLGHTDSGDTLILIRNSWGETWGDCGHAWLMTDYLKTKLIGFASIVP